MKSMTGFGRVSSRSRRSAHSTSQKVSKASKASVMAELDVSVRAVNGRYLEMRLHLPREYAGLESELKSIVSSVLMRGTVDVYINRGKSSAGDSTEISVNTELARKWLKSYRQLGQDLKLTGEPSLELISRVPDVFQVNESTEVSDTEKNQVKKLLTEAVQACDQERVREGKALEKLLVSLCQKLENLASEMESLKAEATSELEKRYRERLQKLGFEGSVEPQRLAQEIVMQLDRADVSEELHRLREHLKAYRKLLKSSEPQGKKLDFYAQELLREVNTIGSKSHIAPLTNLVVEAKTLVEKIREQVQNVE